MMLTGEWRFGPPKELNSQVLVIVEPLTDRTLERPYLGRRRGKIALSF